MTLPPCGQWDVVTNCLYLRSFAVIYDQSRFQYIETFPALNMVLLKFYLQVLSVIQRWWYEPDALYKDMVLVKLVCVPLCLTMGLECRGGCTYVAHVHVDNLWSQTLSLWNLLWRSGSCSGLCPHFVNTKSHTLRSTLPFWISCLDCSVLAVATPAVYSLTSSW